MNFLLPSGLREQRKLLNSLDLNKVQQAVQAEASAQITITGPVNSGKSTLFNQLRGEQLSEVSPIPGTTKESIAERFGPFLLVDTPGMDEVLGDARTQSAQAAISRADVAILVLD